ncbi:hypothetical protein [Usitatibacter palustris]|uniref:Uncharacterized protein n=1 Tax=Usitatibacter palustris TaxID=2732487 RepID=A0A6M4H7E5_9PROT|nr:hypothetical protein [Usitatibacter palustris]QJR15516.1 hypothetical protein DSM104440_02337 [Usitatibacter palustris]
MNAVNRQRTLFLATALALALPATATAATDPRMDKLQACMKIPAATPEQKRCLDELKAMPAPAVAPVATSAAASAPTNAAASAPTNAAAPAPTIKSPAAPAAVAKTPIPASAPPVPAEVKAAASQLGLAGKRAATVAPTPPNLASGVGGLMAGVNPSDISGMDLQLAMATIQSQRAKLLEEQLKVQVDGVHARNNEIAKLNTLIADLKALRPAGTDPAKWANLGANQAAGRAMYKRIQEAGVAIPGPGSADDVNEPGTGIYDARQRTFDAWTAQLKGRIDSLISSQQMDMLQLQSLTNKRNEAFEVMTNFMKKMQDNLSSIVGNVR